MTVLPSMWQIETQSTESARSQWCSVDVTVKVTKSLRMSKGQTGKMAAATQVGGGCSDNYISAIALGEERQECQRQKCRVQWDWGLRCGVQGLGFRV